MAARITRAKKKIARAGIPFRVPPPSELAARTDAVLTVVHLLFTTGHTAPAGADLVRRDLVERALDLARMLRALLPQDAEVAGLLALLLLTDARRPARTSSDGQLVLLADQDRSTWDQAEIAEGAGLLREALRGRPPSRFALMAAIAAVHAESPTWEATDWSEIVGLYDVLMKIWPSPVVALNRAAAIGFAEGPQAGLAELDALGRGASVGRLQLRGLSSGGAAAPFEPVQRGAPLVRGGRDVDRKPGRAGVSPRPAARAAVKLRRFGGQACQSTAGRRSSRQT